MAPAISMLQGLEVRHSHSPSAGSEQCASPTSQVPMPTWDGALGEPAAAVGAASHALSIEHTPKSSFRVTEEADGAGAAGNNTGAAVAATGTAAAGAGGSLSGASPGQLQNAVTAALHELSSSSDADFVSKALALSKVAAAGGYAENVNGGGFIAAGRASGKLQSATIEGADLFELAAGAARDGGRSHEVSHTAALESLEELAAAMNGILEDRP